MRGDRIQKVGLITITIITLIVSTPYDSHAHSSIGKESTIKKVDKYQIAFELYPKFASADENATLHFSILDGNGSNVKGVYAAMVMKEKELDEIVEQTPYKFYEFGDISIPYRFHDNEVYVATLLVRIVGDGKYMDTPLQADFDIAVVKTTTMSINELLLMVIPFMAALIGGFVFLFRKRERNNKL